MITLITGSPGAGKTLYTITDVKAKAAREGREVYYHGIKELMLPWIPLENPESWHEVPIGSIVVLDECQRAFRQQALGQKVPKHVEELETHRHQGIDLFIITQHPMLIDTKVRRLIGEHRHVHRAFGMQRATVHTWGDVRENPDKNRKDSLKRQFSYPAENFGLYKSAEVHTHKAKIPGRIFALLLIPFLIGGCIYSFYRWYVHSKTIAGPVAVSESSFDVSDGRVVSTQNPAAANKTVSAEDFIEAHRPRIAGLAYTAPFYDDITKPVRAPYPAACVLHKVKDDCTCYTNQGTRLDVGKETCKTILNNGFFRYWDDSPGEGHQAPVSAKAGPADAGT